MKIDLKSIIRRAIILLVIGSAVASGIGGANAGLGFILGGLLMIGSFGAACWMVRSADGGGYSANAISALTTLKLPLVGFLIWVLFIYFHPLAVASGGMVLVTAITLNAVLSARARDSSAVLPSTANTTGNT